MSIENVVFYGLLACVVLGAYGNHFLKIRIGAVPNKGTSSTREKEENSHYSKSISVADLERVIGKDDFFADIIRFRMQLDSDEWMMHRAETKRNAEEYKKYKRQIQKNRVILARLLLRYEGEIAKQVALQKKEEASDK